MNNSWWGGLAGFVLALAAIAGATLIFWTLAHNAGETTRENHQTRRARIAACSHLEVPAERILCIDRADR